jgi:hypothetical protein
MPKYPEGKFYVGMRGENPDPKYPCIISGPFDVPPDMGTSGHNLWTRQGHAWVWVRAAPYVPPRCPCCGRA